MNRETAVEIAEVVRALGRTKLATARIKTTPSDGSGRFTAVVSTFGPPPDSYGDVIAPGAFSETIHQAYQRRTYRGDDGLWPLFWMHDKTSATNAIGVVTAATESEKALVIEGQLDLTNQRSVDTYEALLSRRINEFSIAFSAVTEHLDKENGWNVIDSVELTEISVVHHGANAFTGLVSIKSASPNVDVWAKLDALSPAAKSAGPDRVDEFVAQVGAEFQVQRARRAERQRLIEMTNATPAGDAPRVGPGMEPVE